MNMQNWCTVDKERKNHETNKGRSVVGVYGTSYYLPEIQNINENVVIGRPKKKILGYSGGIDYTQELACVMGNWGNTNG
jgi:hypothetical protein